MDGNPLLNPVGSLPPQVYWRRRALAAAVAVLIVVFAWSWFPGGGGAHAAGRPAGTTPAASHTTSPAPTPAATTTTPAAAKTSAKVVPHVTKTSHAPATTSAAPKLATCAASSLLVTLSTDHTAYATGAEPRFVLTVSNVGKTACRVDVGTANRGFVVHSGSDRIWASTDCTKKAANVVVFKPKDTVSYSSVWSRQRSSAAGCAAKGTDARTGTYVVEGHLGDLTTRRAVFRLT